VLLTSVSFFHAFAEVKELLWQILLTSMCWFHRVIWFEVTDV